MINNFFKRISLPFFLIILLLILSVPIQKIVDSNRDKSNKLEKIMFFNSSILNKLSIGYSEIVADIYWFRALQYFGSDNESIYDKDPDLMYKYFDVLTDLDPKFINAYRYGGTFLGENQPDGLGEMDLAMKLMDKGRRNNPDNFRIPLEQGFLAYFIDKDFNKAAMLFEDASDTPGLSNFRSSSIKGMAAALRLKGGERELSRNIWEYIYTTSTNEGRKSFALDNINELNTMDFEGRLTAVADKYKNKYHKYPSSMEILVETGYLKKIPKDHGGDDFFITKELNAIKSKTLTKRILDENIRYLFARSRRYESSYGKYPENFLELKQFIVDYGNREYPEHPLGEEYIYDPVTGIVEYDDYFLQ